MILSYSRLAIYAVIFALTPCHLRAQSRLFIPQSQLSFSLSQAQTPTRVQYSQLYNALKPGLIIEKYSRLRAIQRIHSRLASVAPEQIKVRILSKVGTQSIAIGPDGVAKFPMTDMLLAENPTVESNQPKGSLSVTATMEFDVVGKQTLSYADLAECIHQAEAAMAELGASMAGRRVKSVEFEFAPGQEVRAEVTAESFEELFMADDRGLIRLRIDERKVKAGTRVQFSSRPLSARPQID